MKCQSVVGIWPQTPPSHRITAVAVIHDPPSLYTGAADGSVFWWHFSATSSSADIKPVAMLCGHASPIVDLAVCCPHLTQSQVKDHERDIEVGSFGCNQAALVSACSDGVLCVWSRGSGHCRLRRKLPLWVGSPSSVQMLPTNRRYVCVASCFIDSLRASDHDCMDSTEGSDVTGDQESFIRQAAKYAIVIVDSYTLTIVQTVFHGHLSVGKLKYMTLVGSTEDNQTTSAVIIDSYGKIQLIPLVQDFNPDKEDAINIHDGSALMTNDTTEKGLCGGLLVSVATSGLIIGLVYQTECVFILLPTATVIGVISFTKNDYSTTADCNLSNVAGGMLISPGISCATQSTEPQNMYNMNFVVWDDRGCCILYKTIFVESTFSYEVVCEIPACSYPMNVTLSLNVIQLGAYILRVESACFHVEDALLWRPCISICSLQQQFDARNNCGNIYKLVRENDCLVDGIDDFYCAFKGESLKHHFKGEPPVGEDSATHIDSSLGQENTASLHKGHVQKERIVSSTMVISQNSYYPNVMVYGYHSGDIEVVQFNLIKKLESDSVPQCPEIESHGSRQLLSGHTASVLCLAAPQKMGSANDQAYRKVLLSGSLDCTLRIWDLDTYKPIMVMHHHVAPVRQIILPPLQSYHPWDNCFLSVGEDSCIALVSLDTLRVERMFPGHRSHPSQVVWDGVRGYLACLSLDHSRASGSKDALYIWDIKSGSRERVLRGTAAHSMFSNFCKSLGSSNVSGCSSNYNTSTSSLDLPWTEYESSITSKLKTNKSSSELNLVQHGVSSIGGMGRYVKPDPSSSEKVPIRCYRPHSGIASLSFDLSSLLSLDDKRPASDLERVISSSSIAASSDSSEQGKLQEPMEDHHHVNLLKLCLLRFSLSFLHLWGVDCELDNLMVLEMNVQRYEKFMLAPGLEGDRGSFTLAFPAFGSTLQLWKSSSEFCALRSLIMVSLAQNMVSLCNSCSGASSALSAFYTRNFAEKVPYVKPPLLQLLVSFWQDEDEHVRMAAKSLFHCAASRAIPPPLCCLRLTNQTNMAYSLDQVCGSNSEHVDKIETRDSSLLSERPPEIQASSRDGESHVLNWLDSYDLQDWISCVGGTSQDAMASHIIVAAALAIWYPSLVNSNLAMFVVHPLIKLVMAMNEKYSSAAAELLAEGMDCTWKVCLGAEIHHLIGDIFFQIECVSTPSANVSSVTAAVPPKLQETLIGILLPSLALGDIPGFLSVIEGLIWSTASDSPVHLVSLKTLIRLMRGSPRNLAQYLNKVVSFILQTIDPANSVMRKTCLQSSMATLREVVRVYPMVALNDTSTRLAVGDAIVEFNNPSIHVYDMQSVTKMKVLDATGPPGLPTFLSRSQGAVLTAISALSFSPDGEGLVAFSEHGLIIRWWSLGTAWWEKLSRNIVPVQCTKVIFVPPWEGFSPNSSRASIMANIGGNHRETNSQEHINSSHVDSLNLLLYNLDLSYRLEWAGDRKVRLMKHGLEIDTFLL